MSVDVHHPGPTSPEWDDPQTVRDIAQVSPADVEAWNRLVLPTADHTRIHSLPQPGCPGCPAGGVERDRSSERYWIEVSR
jgi:hypothetical protein